MEQTDKSHSSNKDVFAVGVGLCALDYICLIEKYPGPDEKRDALQFSRTGGGPVPSALCAISHFGEKSSFIGKCGNDPEGRIVASELKRFDVDIQAMIFDTYSRTPRAFIWVDSHTGQRTVVLDRTEIADLTEAELNQDIIKSCRYLLINCRYALTAAYALAFQGGGGGTEFNYLRQIPIFPKAIDKCAMENIAGSGCINNFSLESILMKKLALGGANDAISAQSNDYCFKSQFLQFYGSFTGFILVGKIFGEVFRNYHVIN